MYFQQKPRFSFSQIELKELAIAAFAITLIFVWPIQPSFEWAIIFGYYLVFVGLGFTLHEIGHKLMAQSLGARSEFRMWSKGLQFALFMRLIGGPVFIAPEATYWAKYNASIEDHGKVSLAGPVTNIVLALIFMGTAFLNPVMLIGARVNLQLAFFNLIPFGPLDGVDLLRWNWLIWVATMGIVLGLQQLVNYIVLIA